MAHSFESITYKKVGSLEIQLSLYLHSKAPSSPVPILVWFHGGGLLQGHRDSVAPHMLAVIDSGIALVSADYRLAPQASAAEILTDVQDCLAFVRDQLQASVQASSGITLDTKRICVSGSSAGGYLSLLGGLHSDVPKVALAIYPITDPWGVFFTTPHPRPNGPVDDAWAPYLDKNGEVVANSLESSTRRNMYGFMLQEGNLADLLSVAAGDSKLRIAKALQEKGSYPPCYIVHGDADGAVGVEQADEVVAVLKGLGSVVEYERPKGLDHGFDGDAKVKLEEMYAFMAKHL